MSDRPEEGYAQFELIPPEDAGDTPATYANFFQATVSPLDLTLHLGWYAIPPLTEAPTGPVRVQVRPLMKVSLPIGLLPGIIQVLQTQLESWERSQEARQAEEASRSE